MEALVHIYIFHIFIALLSSRRFLNHFLSCFRLLAKHGSTENRFTFWFNLFHRKLILFVPTRVYVYTRARALLSHQQGIHPFCGEIKNVYLVEIESFRSTSSEEYTHGRSLGTLLCMRGMDDKLIKWIWAKILKYYSQEIRFYGIFISRGKENWVKYSFYRSVDLIIDEIKVSMTFHSFEYNSVKL